MKSQGGVSLYGSSITLVGGGPRVVVSTAAFHARVRGSVPGLGGLKETKLFLPHPRVKVSIVGSLRDREVACSASDRQGSNFESCVWWTVSSQSSHHPQEVLLAQFSLYVHKGGLKPDSFHFNHPGVSQNKGGGGPRFPVSAVWKKMFLSHPRVKPSILESLRDHEIACSAWDHQGSNFESCVWRKMSSHSSHHPQEVLLTQFSLYVHKSGLKPDSFHFQLSRNKMLIIPFSIVIFQFFWVA